MNVVALPRPERGDHVIRGPGIDRFQRLIVDPAFVTRIAEHVQRLTAMVNNHLTAGKIAELKRRFRCSPDQKEAVVTVDLGKVQRRRCLTTLGKGEGLAGRGLDQIYFSTEQRLKRRYAVLSHCQIARQAFFFEKTTCDGSN